jgi:hypothetical protein
MRTDHAALVGADGRVGEARAGAGVDAWAARQQRVGRGSAGNVVRKRVELRIGDAGLVADRIEKCLVPATPIRL